MADFIKVAKLSDIGEGKLKFVEVEGEEICLINSGGSIYAMEEHCTHEDGPIHEGFLEGKEVTCPWHQAKFDIKTGKVNSETDFAKRDLKTYEVKVEGEDILVKL